MPCYNLCNRVIIRLGGPVNFKSVYIKINNLTNPANFGKVGNFKISGFTDGGEKLQFINYPTTDPYDRKIYYKAGINIDMF